MRAVNQALEGCRLRLGSGGGRFGRKVRTMRDFLADWKRWSRAERVLAVIVTTLMVALPLGLLISGKGGI